MSFRTKILEAAALQEISPLALRAYAVGQGWQRTERFGEHSDVYVLDGKSEAIIPGTERLADYAQVMSDIISLFAKIEGRDELQIYRDLSTADQDVIRVRAPGAEDDGSVKIDSGVSLFQHARDLLLSAACSAFDPRATYRAGRVKEASEYMGRVRFGQTERGSFIVTLLSPVPPALAPLGQTDLWPRVTEDPFPRQVTRRLVNGLDAAKHAIENTNRGGDFSAFEETIARGVSANLCDAAASLIEQGKGLDVSVTWAKTRRAPEKRHEVSFATSDSDVLREAAKLFREREPRLDENLEGYIIKLARNHDESDGQATLATLVDARQVSVRMDLPKAIYESAIKAHKSGLPVTVGGDLTREGQRWRLKNPRFLRVRQVSEDDE